MVRTAAEKVQRAADVIPPLEVRGPESGDVLLLGWGGTYGAITTAGDELREEGPRVAHRAPALPQPLPEEPRRGAPPLRETSIVPEINLGQLRMLIRDRFLIDAIGINEVRARCSVVDVLVEKTLEIMNR